MFRLSEGEMLQSYVRGFENKSNFKSGLIILNLYKIIGEINNMTKI